MHLEEVNHMYPKDFMSNQAEVTEKMRAYLIDWLESDFKKKELQCLGLTALHIAGKYEEIYPPSLKDLLRVTDNAVTKDQVLKLEFTML
jgi:cyclin B